jgi:hypothetical protein
MCSLPKVALRLQQLGFFGRSSEPARLRSFRSRFIRICCGIQRGISSLIRERIPDRWRIISVIAIYNRPLDTLRLRLIDLRSSGRTSVCESPWRRRTPGALCCRSGFPPIPAETCRKYSKRSPLTVLFRPQVQNYSLARL